MTGRGCFGAVCVAWLLVGGLSAQTNTGEISGVVADSSGGVLPGATVVARHPDTGFTSERVTDADGRFFLPALPTGDWEISAELPGFRRATLTGVSLELGRTVEVEFGLSLDTLSEEVTVEVVAPLLQTTTAEISDVIESREVEQIPLNGRQFLQLALLSDAVIIPPGGTRGEALQQAGPLPNVGGQRSGHNIYLLDGFKVTDELFNNLVINPSVDSIREFKIQKSQYAPEFGGKASALINVATKAGTNRFHGSLFNVVRDERFDAHNFFDDRSQPVPPLDQKQYGGALGGPLVENRTFFFLSYERQDTRRSLTKTFSVPDAAARRGDFSGWDPICNPSTINAATGACTPFPGNQIPESQLDPIAQAFLGNVPLPTGAGQFQNLTSVEAQDTDAHQFSLRVDHRVTARDQVFGRFSTFDADEQQPFGTSAQQEALVPGFGRTLDTTTRNLGISHTRTFSRQMLNEVRFGYLRVDGGQRSLNRGVDFASQVGLLGVSASPRDAGFPQVSTAGLFSTMGDPTTFVSRDNEHFELYNNVLLDRRAHHLKFGAYLFHLRFRPVNADTARGAFSYTGQWTGNALADFLLGFPTAARAGVGGGDENARTTWLHLYAQDDWRLRDNLTVNYGLRYEYNSHMKDVDNRLSSIDFSVPGGRYVIASDDAGNISPDAAALLPLIPIPWVTSAEAGWDRSLLRPSKLRLAPRFGFALSLGEERPMVLRGGYGVFLNQWAYSVQTAFTRNLPFFVLKQVDAPADQLVPTLRTSDILASDATGNVGGTIMDNNYQVEYTQTWSGGLQIEAAPQTMFEVAYMGSYTLGADNSTIRNVPVPGPGAIDARRPIPGLSAVSAIRFDGTSIYHAVTFKAERRFNGRFSFNTSYTVSQSRDDASSPGATAFEANVPQDVRNIFPGEEALSSFHHRHQFVASGSYRLPFFEGVGGAAEALGAGWRVNLVATVLSGAPFTVNLGQDVANIGAGPAQRPNQIEDPALPASQRSPQQWFNTSAFALPGQFTFGSALRNSVFAPGMAVVDLSIQKDWPVGLDDRLEVRWEIFNLLNRANFDIPNRVFGTPNFGRIFSAQNAREMQFGLRYSF
ncbi:MAG: TonB-dependent receptor [Acidobacteria bacterium]|nr:TonB-dependent receptor [Acidobacteriota bacterium]